MKEFGLYILKPNYITQFSVIDKSLQGIKAGTRPFVCIKVNVGKQNWVVPIASLNPAAPDYRKKLSKYNNFYILDKAQAAKEKRPYARAITIFKDLTGLQSDPDFKSVVEYYNALPVKHKYCKKFRDKSGKHIVITDQRTKNIIKRALSENIAAKLKSEEVGFIKAKIAEGKTDYKDYPKKSLEIREELYKDHIALQKAEQEKKALAEQRRAEEERKRTLKNKAKSSSAPSKVEIEPQRIVSRSENGDVQIKLPGAKPEDVKIKVTLPKDSIVLDKDGQNVIVVTSELQQKYNLKLRGGQTRRILKF